MNTIYSYLKRSSLLLIILMIPFVIGCNFDRDPILGKGGDTTGAIQDTTPPTIINTSAYGNTGVTKDGTGFPKNRSSTATFSKQMDASSIITTPSVFTVENTRTNQEVPGSVTYNIASKTITFKPTNNFEANTLYTSKISTAAEDLAGNALEDDYVWSWTTGSIDDTERPTVLKTVPLNKAKNTRLNQTVSATFSEEMDSDTISKLTFTVGKSGSPVLDGLVLYDPVTKIATFKPLDKLAPGTTYTATITNQATDLADNKLEGNQPPSPAASDYVWTFTTGATQDVTPPKVISTAAYGTTGDIKGKEGLFINRSSTATFSKPMDESSITSPPAITVKNKENGQPVLGLVTYNIDSKTITFKPTNPFVGNTLYISKISTAAKDLAGNKLASDYVWSWKTGSTDDKDRPTVLKTVPEDEASEVRTNQIMSATFSEEMDSDTITDLSFTVAKSGSPDDLDGSVEYNVLTKTATFKPQDDLNTNTTYTATIKKEATDLADNKLDGNQQPSPVESDYEWTFTTRRDVAPPVKPAANLGLAETFGMAATSGITNTGATQINGDVVLNPKDQCNSVTVDNTGGFGLCGGTPPIINGEVITPTNPDTTTAQEVTDALRAAYLEITPANMPGATPIAAPTSMGGPVGDALVQGVNLFSPGVYESGTSILISGDLTLDAQNDSNANFVFQAGSTIGTAPNTRILLVNGAKASNIWWQAGSDATLQTNTTWQGNILAYRDITMVTGTKSCGRLFAGAFTDGAFVFDSNDVSVPGHSSAPADCK